MSINLAINVRKLVRINLINKKSTPKKLKDKKVTDSKGLNKHICVFHSSGRFIL